MTQLRLHDSLRNQKVPFEPLVPGKVGMYVCGPTTYAPAHIGHAFSAISFDTIRRGLKFLGYEVKYVRNVTDIDDKIINRANETGEDPMVLSKRHTDGYNRDMARFNVLPPDLEPKVTGHIAEIIAITEKLIANGKAYASDGDVYFSVASFPPYGRLSRMDIDQLRAGASERTVAEVTERKRDIADFALWKAAKPGEPSWDSPWGKGRPGWHIECSAMTVTHLGSTFDIHGGGKDLIFPHHENEIAQSQGADGEGTFARYWLHNGFLNFDGVKMSKSLGNVFNCEQIADVVGGEALRYFCVQHHYQSPVEFEVEPVKDAEGKTIGVIFRSLEAADRRLAYFYETLQKIDALVGTAELVGPVMPDAEKLVSATRDALADNFNTPVVVAAMGEAAALANRLIDQPKGVDKQLRLRTLARVAADLRATGAAIGIFETPPNQFLADRRDRLVKARNIDTAHVEQLLADRTAARAAKDFTRADAIRGELDALRVGVIDTPGGSTWRVLDDAG